MIQQITGGSNTCFAQECSSVTAVITAITDDYRIMTNLEN